MQMTLMWRWSKTRLSVEVVWMEEGGSGCDGDCPRHLQSRDGHQHDSSTRLFLGLTLFPVLLSSHSLSAFVTLLPCLSPHTFPLYFYHTPTLYNNSHLPNPFYSHSSTLPLPPPYPSTLITLVQAPHA